MAKQLSAIDLKHAESLMICLVRYSITKFCFVCKVKVGLLGQ